MAKQRKKEPEVAKFSPKDRDQVIALMGIYLDEWKHRDTLLWSQVFKLFYVNLIVIVLPNIAESLHIALPPINEKLFPVIGIFMAIIFLYIGLGYAVRLKASSRTYGKMMEALGDKNWKRISIQDRNEMKFGWLFGPSLAEVLVVTMFFVLIAVSVLLLAI